MLLTNYKRESFLFIKNTIIKERMSTYNKTGFFCVCVKSETEEVLHWFKTFAEIFPVFGEMVEYDNIRKMYIVDPTE